MGPLSAPTIQAHPVGFGPGAGRERRARTARRRQAGLRLATRTGRYQMLSSKSGGRMPPLSRGAARTVVAGCAAGCDLGPWSPAFPA